MRKTDNRLRICRSYTHKDQFYNLNSSTINSKFESWLDWLNQMHLKNENAVYFLKQRSKRICIERYNYEYYLRFFNEADKLEFILKFGTIYSN